MWAFMAGDKNNFASSNKAGKERVHKENGKYAFLMESTSVEYIIERECELTQIGGLLDSKGYGIALPPSKNKLSELSLLIGQIDYGVSSHDTIELPVLTCLRFYRLLMIVKFDVYLSFKEKLIF